MNDYATQLFVAQHHQELLALAAHERLARIVRSGSQPWWRRLQTRPAAPARQAARLVPDGPLPSRG
jgi:hypothetical protein